MRNWQIGHHTVKSHGKELLWNHRYDWLILILLAVTDAILAIIEPFHRFVGKNMMIDLSYPLKPNTVPFWAVPVIALLLPIIIFIIIYIFRRDVYDLHHAILGVLFSVLLTAVITDAIKNAVGRPRPDFFWRCFPDGVGVSLLFVSPNTPTNSSFQVYDNITSNVNCTGLKSVIKEGHKSFPSGHTSGSFSGLGFSSWYIAGKIKAFDRKGHIAKLCLVSFPLLVAALVGVSRVDDYWHHWQDVFAGASIGLVVASFCYLQFFPFPNHVDGWGPHAFFNSLREAPNGLQSSSDLNHLRGVQTEVFSISSTNDERPMFSIVSENQRS